MLSLTVIRVIPVAVALFGAALTVPTIAYVSWFGPRGLASIVFADLIATNGLPEQSTIATVVSSPSG